MVVNNMIIDLAPIYEGSRLGTLIEHIVVWKLLFGRTAFPTGDWVCQKRLCIPTTIESYMDGSSSGICSAKLTSSKIPVQNNQSKLNEMRRSSHILEVIHHKTLEVVCNPKVAI